VRYLTSSLCQARYDRERLKGDLSDCRQRAQALAQEVDEAEAKAVADGHRAIR